MDYGPAGTLAGGLVASPGDAGKVTEGVVGLAPVDAGGAVYAKSSRPDSTDFAVYLPVSEPVEVGDVLVVDRENSGRMLLGAKAADPGVVGIVVGGPGAAVAGGISMIPEGDAEAARQFEEARSRKDATRPSRMWEELEAKSRWTNALVAFSGIAPCKVDAGYGAIQVGDLLSVSPTKGAAMRANQPGPGTILGKALEALEDGTGTIKVLIMLR